MLRVIATLGLALSLLGCAAVTPRGAQVPLPIDKSGADRGRTIGHGCVLMYQIVDVVADPDTGTPVIKGGGREMFWPKGFTAWRVGAETEVIDGAGGTVLRTGERYWTCPQEYLDGWVVGDVKRCPAGEVIFLGDWTQKCELGSGVM